jgi:hypothetical protein
MKVIICSTDIPEKSPHLDLIHQKYYISVRASYVDLQYDSLYLLEIMKIKTYLLLKIHIQYMLLIMKYRHIMAGMLQ